MAALSDYCVVDTDAYVDAINVWFTKKPSNDELKLLRQYCGSTCFKQRPRRGIVQTPGMTYGPHLDRKKRDFCRWMRLNQPQQEAFEILDRVGERYGIHINYVELALDLLVPSAEEANRLYDFLDEHFVKLWRRNDRVVYVYKTRYTRVHKWPCQVVVLYADRPSKRTGLHCAHLEWRFWGALVSCRSTGSGEPIGDSVRRPPFFVRLYFSGKAVLETT